MKQKMHVLLDEFHSLSATIPTMLPIRKYGTAVVITQAVIRRNSGKRIIFIGSARREDGTPIKQAPKKFIPAQVLRRRALENV